MAVLERLSPLERVVFVLCNAFDLTFDEIASVDDLEDRSLTSKKTVFDFWNWLKDRGKI